jgi:sugar lactone lactonase YvrE
VFVQVYAGGLLNYSTKRAVHFLVGVFSAWLLLLFANTTYAQNTISTVAGGPPPNNVAPTAAAATLEGPQTIVRDAFGNFFVITDSGVIYKVAPPGTAPSLMSIYAGNNTAGFSANGTAASSTLTNEPYGTAVDANGNLYFSDSSNCVVREIVGGVVETAAGNGTCGFAGDGGPATSASLNFPQGMAMDSSGNLYIADLNNSVIRRVDSNGNISTYAGTPDITGFPGDGIPATTALLYAPVAVAVDTTGNLFISDENDNVICRVDAASKILTIVAGTGAFGYSGDGGLAISAAMAAPDGVAVDGSGNIYIADSENSVIREVFSPTNETMPNIITTVAGNGTFGFGGDNGPALSAELSNPAGLFVDSTTGNLWIADYWNNRIRMYNASSLQITTVVGSGLVGDGGLATSASFYFPRTPALDSQGDLFITDAENNRIREVNATSQIITTVVGSGVPCAKPTLPCGDGGPATSASIFMPRTITIAPSGDLLVADDGDNKIREVSGETGNITTIVGSGGRCGTGPQEVPWPCGDGGPALSASLNDARGAVLDAAGNLYFVDAQDNRVREVHTTGTITTVAGDGPDGNAPTGCNLQGNLSGDGGPAVSATLDCPLGLDMDSQGNLYVADTYNNVIRLINTGTPRIITTIAGTGTAGHTGDGGLATNATLNSPDRVSVNGAGNFFISDSGNNVIRRVDGASGIITAFAGNGTFAFAGDGGPALSASFATPVGVVVDSQGNMYVGDVFNNRIRKVLLNPNISFSTTSVPFGNQPINATAILPLTITNSGDAPLTISNIAASEGPFSISANPCPVAPATLAVGAQCVLEIAFMPTQFISYTGTITVTDNVPASGSMQTINLSGTGGATLDVAVTGSGTVTSSPAGINCPTTCSAVFAGNSQITLTATPSPGSVFAGWGGDVCEGTGSCTFTITAAASVTANFTVSPNFGLTVTEAGTGTGAVRSAPAGINCPSACSANFASGTQVTLTASASANSTFAGWSGGSCTGTGTCVVAVTAATAVTATFNGASPVTIGIGQGSSSTVTTTPGSSAVFGLVLTALPGTTGTVQLTCSSPVASITCSIVPSSITLTGKAINVAIVVETFCKGSLPNFVPIPGGLGTGLGLLLATLCLFGVAWTYKKQPRWAVSFGLLVIFAMGMTACSNVAKSPSGSATPPGNYPLVVTASAPNGGTSSVSLTLKVQ